MAISIQKFFSISIPVGAWHPMLPASLRSLRLQQDSAEIAFLDASGDARVEGNVVASGIELAYKRVGPDTGQADAIAEGWSNTKAPILAWLNADDILLPGVLEKVGRTFQEKPHIDVVYGDSVIIDGDGATVAIQDQVNDVGPRIFRSNPISQPSCFVRRSAVEAIGGIDRSLNYTMDWDLWARLYESGKKFERTPAFLSAVYWGPGTKTSQLGLARIREIHRLARNAGPVASLKTLLSLYLERILSTERLRVYQNRWRDFTGSKHEVPRSFTSVPVVNLTPTSAGYLKTTHGIRRLEMHVEPGHTYLVNCCAHLLPLERPRLVNIQ